MNTGDANDMSADLVISHFLDLLWHVSLQTKSKAAGFNVSNSLHLQL
ncbi:hypothetical protein SH528x_000963 [Novipirellula sp. SH528]